MDFAKKEIKNVVYERFSVGSFTFNATEKKNCFQPHWHEKFEFILINSGIMTVNVNNNVFEAHPGTIITVSPNYLHSGDSGNEGCNYSVLSFDHKYLMDSSIYEQTLNNNLLNHKLLIDTVINDDTARNNFINIINICNKRTLSQPILEKGYACIFFSHLVENFSVNNNMYKTGNNKFNNVIDYISQNYTKQITTKQIAEQFSYNESYFCRKFSEITNLTPTEFILNLRIEHSQKLMASSALTLSAIAQQSGFSSYPYFSSKFKQLVGSTPAEWRQNLISKMYS